MLLNFLAEKKHSATDQTFLAKSQKLSWNAKVLIFCFDLVPGILTDLTCKQWRKIWKIWRKNHASEKPYLDFVWNIFASISSRMLPKLENYDIIKIQDNLHKLFV